MNRRARIVVFLICSTLIITTSIITVFFLFFSVEEEVYIRLATTTSTENSGLLDNLHEEFYKTSNIRVDVIAVGTGAAIEAGAKGDVDLIMVHAREKEDEFIATGTGIYRVDLMYNDFIIVGPGNDPAGIRDLTNVSETLFNIYNSRAKWISRGDDSGTHFKELGIWSSINFIPQTDNQTWIDANPWYIETGQGMGATLTIAAQSEAYTLTDRGTWIFQRDSLNGLEVLCEGDPFLFNPYGVILINPQVYSHVKFEEAKTYVMWLISDEGQNAIASYKVDGEQLFFPDFKNHISEMNTEGKTFWDISI
ncbi:MAG: substrate-binding domain-containing protein [Promethearchaeota archaeon]